MFFLDFFYVKNFFFIILYPKNADRGLVVCIRLFFS